MFRLDNKIGIITGAARGIGSAIARTLASQGATVALVDILLDEVSALASEIGPNARAYQADLAKIDNINAVVKKIASDYGSIDILVNNAGICPRLRFVDFPENPSPWKFSREFFRGARIRRPRPAVRWSEVTPSSTRR